jgi:hypothetical protein
MDCMAPPAESADYQACPSQCRVTVEPNCLRCARLMRTRVYRLKLLYGSDPPPPPGSPPCGTCYDLVKGADVDVRWSFGLTLACRSHQRAAQAWWWCVSRLCFLGGKAGMICQHTPWMGCSDGMVGLYLCSLLVFGLPHAIAERARLQQRTTPSCSLVTPSL